MANLAVYPAIEWRLFCRQFQWLTTDHELKWTPFVLIQSAFSNFFNLFIIILLNKQAWNRNAAVFKALFVRWSHHATPYSYLTLTQSDLACHYNFSPTQPMQQNSFSRKKLSQRKTTLQLMINSRVWMRLEPDKQRCFIFTHRRLTLLSLISLSQGKYVGPDDQKHCKSSHQNLPR